MEELAFAACQYSPVDRNQKETPSKKMTFEEQKKELELLCAYTSANCDKALKLLKAQSCQMQQNNSSHVQL